MLRYSFRMEAAAAAIETAIERVLKRGVRTAELPGKSRPTTTSRMGELIADTTQKILRSNKSRA
jgi:3-isopropylmalate dehydrogenase